MPILSMGQKGDSVSKLISLTPAPGKILKQVLLETIPTYVKDKRVTSNSKQRFKKGKPCLNNFMVFYDKMPSETCKRMVVNVLYFDFI